METIHPDRGVFGSHSSDRFILLFHTFLVGLVYLVYSVNLVPLDRLEKLTTKLSQSGQYQLFSPLGSQSTDFFKKLEEARITIDLIIGFVMSLLNHDKA